MGRRGAYGWKGKSIPISPDPTMLDAIQRNGIILSINGGRNAMNSRAGRSHPLSLQKVITGEICIK
jgi:hypothetical protein